MCGLPTSSARSLRSTVAAHARNSSAAPRNRRALEGGDGAGRQQLQAVPQMRPLESSLDIGTRIGKVSPPLEVERHDGGVREGPGGLDALGGRERQMMRSYLAYPCRAHEQEGDADGGAPRSEGRRVFRSMVASGKARAALTPSAAVNVR